MVGLVGSNFVEEDGPSPLGAMAMASPRDEAENKPDD